LRTQNKVVEKSHCRVTQYKINKTKFGISEIAIRPATASTSALVASSCPSAQSLSRIENCPRAVTNRLQLGRAGRHPIPRWPAQPRSLSNKRGNKLPSPNLCCVSGLGFLFVAVNTFMFIAPRYSNSVASGSQHDVRRNFVR
jgi:hypothetical protein